MSAPAAPQPPNVALLILRDEGIDWSDERAKAMLERFVEWTAELSARGVLHGVEGLMRQGKTVRHRGGTLVVDGPYVEGREAVLGFVAVRVADLDEACRLAAESPYTALGGAIEVRMTSAFPKAGAGNRPEARS
ncbi:MAG TPA: YciI family protein [Polyangiaceae bacterium]|nr:YciI family protein [Polyangiaceae bacterium]